MDKSDSGKLEKSNNSSARSASSVCLARQAQTPPNLHAGFRSVPPVQKSSMFLRHYMPVATIVLAISFLLLTLHIWPPVEIFLICIAFVASIWGLTVAFTLFQAHPKYGAWYANRTAAMVIMAVMIDYWLWVFGGTYDSVSSYTYMGVNLAFFVLIMGVLFSYFYRNMHIGNVVRLLLLKCLFDFGAFVVSGGLGIGLFNRLGIIHPLRVSTALAMTAALEMTVVLVYLFFYRRKIAPPSF